MTRLFAALLVGVVVGALLVPRLSSSHHSIAHNYVLTKRVVDAVFGPYGTQRRALGVSGCETGRIYNRNARNRWSDTRGIFQIQDEWIGQRIWWGRRSILVRDNLFGRWPNARYALFLSRGGRDWSHWAPVCRR